MTNSEICCWRSYFCPFKRVIHVLSEHFSVCVVLGFADAGVGSHRSVDDASRRHPAQLYALAQQLLRHDAARAHLEPLLERHRHYRYDDTAELPRLVHVYVRRAGERDCHQRGHAPHPLRHRSRRCLLRRCAGSRASRSKRLLFGLLVGWLVGWLFGWLACLPHLGTLISHVQWKRWPLINSYAEGQPL